MGDGGFNSAQVTPTNLVVRYLFKVSLCLVYIILLRLARMDVTVHLIAVHVCHINQLAGI